MSDAAPNEPVPRAGRRILVGVGTRPEAIKMAPVIRALRGRPWAEVRVLATAQHRELLDQVLAFFGIVPDVDLDLMRPGQTLADLTSRMLLAVDRALAAERPDLVLAQGDTTTVMVMALACFYRRIPFGHVEAGLRTGDRAAPFPEEMNRALTGWLADLHFAPTAGAAANLRREGVADARVLVTGNPVIDALLWAAAQDLPRDVLPGDGRRLVLLTAHRRESFGAPLRAVLGAVRDLVACRDIAVLYPVHPNPNVQSAAREVLGRLPHVHLVEPLDYPRFVAAMRAAHLILTDSGGVQEEAPSLGKPVLVLRDTTERPEGVAAGNSRLVGTDRAAIVAAALELLDDERVYARMAQAANPYGDGRAAERIAAGIERLLTVAD